MTGLLTTAGLDVTVTGPPYNVDDQVIDSNATEHELQQWFASQQPPIAEWQTEGAGDGRARVWFALADEDLLQRIATDFGDRVDVDGGTLIFDANRSDYEALHDRIGTRPEIEPRLECIGETVELEPGQIGGPAPPATGCRLSAFDHNEARVALAGAPQPDDMTLSLLVQEASCASGRTPPPEDVVVVLDESAERIAVWVVLTRPRGSVQECPENPVKEVEVTLSQPVGDRSVVPYTGGAPLGIGATAVRDN